MTGVEPDPAGALELCERTLALLGDRAEGVANAEVGHAGLTRFANSRIHQNVGEVVRRVELAVVAGGRFARGATTRADGDGLAALVERVLAAAALRPVDPHAAGFAPPAPVPPVEHWDEGTATAGPDERAHAVAAFVAAGGPVAARLTSGAGGEAAGYCATRAGARALAATTGQRAVARTSAARLDGIHRVAAAGQPADGGAQAVSTRWGELDAAACGVRAAATARAGVDPIDLPPGDYEVVLSPRAVAAVLSFPAHLGFNGKAHAEGRSFVRPGERQWDPSIDIWDDATDPRALGVPWDAEGTPRRRHDLVRAGVSVGLTHDRRSARLAGDEPTGHSVGDEALGGVPTDLFLRGGDAPPASLVGRVERGLLVSDLWYNRVLDAKTQVVTGLTRNGLFLVEGGEVVGAVRNMRFTQSVVEAFGPGRVLGLGDDAQLAGTGEGATAHVPSVRLASWSFTGNAQR